MAVVTVQCECKLLHKYLHNVRHLWLISSVILTSEVNALSVVIRLVYAIEGL